MAKEPDPQVQAFMAEVMRRLGVSTGGGLTRRLIALGAIQPDAYRKVPKWVRGENAPDHHATIALLRVAGMLAQRDAPPGTMEQARQAAVRLADEAEALVALLADEA